VPGVADVVLDEYSRGIGTGAVYIKAITPTVSDFLISLVQDAVDRVRAFGNLIEARAPNAVGVEMDITLIYINLFRLKTKQISRCVFVIHCTSISTP